MNPYVVPVYCDVCGWGGMTRPQDAVRMFTEKGQMRHTNPNVCAEILEVRRRQLESLEDEKARKEGAIQVLQNHKVGTDLTQRQ